MELVQAILLGALQGVTEWLPISSSGHLALAQHFLGVSPPLLFDLALHAGTLLALVVFFRKEILELLRALASLDFQSPAGKLIPLLVLAMLPTALIGFAFKPFFESMFSAPLLVGAALLVNGAFLYLTKFAKAGKELGVISSLVVGVAQGLAVAPGISRSGATISTALLQGVERRKAAVFSFLLAIPAVGGASAYEFASNSGSLAGVGSDALVLGIIVAGIIGYLSLGLLFRVLDSRRFHQFAYYCWLVGAVAIALSLQ